MYGIPADERVQDVDWLERAGTDGWTVLMKDSAIAKNPLELAAVHQFRVKAFSLARQDLAAHRMSAWFLNNLDSIVTACAQPGPFIYSVGETKITLLA